VIFKHHVALNFREGEPASLGGIVGPLHFGEVGTSLQMDEKRVGDRAASGGAMHRVEAAAGDRRATQNRLWDLDLGFLTKLPVDGVLDPL